MIDYAEFQSAIGLNWYDIDPNLQLQMRRLLEPADFDWLEPELRKVGALCGGPVAARAEITDKHSPELVKFDRWAIRSTKCATIPAHSPPSATSGKRE